jgi:iron complex outermembrane receptor protein
MRITTPRRLGRLAGIGLIALAWLAPTLARAQEQVADASGSDEEQELAELLTILDQETAVATKSKMNSDYVPGIVTVLEADELEALGVEWVWDALALVPGIQPVRGNVASPSTLVRGIQFPFNSGNIKILLDGVPFTRQSSSINGSVLFLPIEQVERIEVIRGPGSVVYGDFAFMGLVNIITRKEGSRVYLRGDDNEEVSGGARIALGDAASPWQLSANLAGDARGNAATTRPRRAEADAHSAIVSLRRGAFSLEGQWIQGDRDDVSPAGTPGQPTNGNEETWALDAGYERELAKDLHASFHANLLSTDATGGPLHFEDSVKRAQGDLSWDGWAGQSWLVGVEYNAQDIRHASATLVAPPGAPPPPSVVIDGRERDIASFLLQDRVDLGDAWSVTVGARYDDYSDVGSRVTPRLSLVWRASDRHILKAQYAEGFRAPTFFEAYRTGTGQLNRNLDFEVNRTTELNYVYRRPLATGRATVFHMQLDDMIFVAGTTFANTREAQSEGIELEWTQELSSRLKVLASGSWVDTEDNRGPTFLVHESEAAPDWMGDLALLWQPWTGGVAALHWNHVADRGALAGDDAFDLVDLTLNASGLFGTSLGVKAGVKNALDDDVAYVQVPPTGIVAGAVYGRRTVWAQLSWHW